MPPNLIFTFVKHTPKTFYPVLPALLLLLSACERTMVCTEPAVPAFPQSYRGMLPTDSGEILSFTDGVRQIDFTTTLSKADVGRPALRYTTPESRPCGCPPSYKAQADWDAQSAASAVHPAIRFWYNASYGDTTLTEYSTFENGIGLWWMDKGPNAYFRYYPVLGDRAHGDSVALNLRLGNRSYDRVVVITADTMKANAPDVWRVYFANPGGIVGFESRYTKSLFWQQ